MSKDEIKYEINKMLDQLSDQSLESLLSLLKEVEAKRNKEFSEHLQRILSEDDELLYRLAQ
jgi:hypothetical protein